MIIQSKQVWLHGHFIEAQIEITDSSISRIYPYDFFPADRDYGRNMILPGFIDVHIHGAFGFDTNDADQDGLIKIVQGLPSEGVTAFCPTTVTQDKKILIEALKNVANVHKLNIKGSQIVGVHFEGPYLDFKFKGAQPAEHILSPSVEEFKEFELASEGLIKIVTMATEKDIDFKLTKYCTEKEIVVSIGHSASTYDECIMAVAHGAKSMTHVFNGMTPIHHRNYGISGAAHRLSGVYGEIIGDGNHVVWPAIYTLMMSKGKFHNILITDALNVKGSGPGSYELGGQTIEVRENLSAYIKGTNTLSGSTLKVNEGIRNLVEKAQVPFEYAINAATINPATLLGLEHRKGKIHVGFDADIVVLNEEYSVLSTYIMGDLIYKN